MGYHGKPPGLAPGVLCDRQGGLIIPPAKEKEKEGRGTEKKWFPYPRKYLLSVIRYN